MKQEEDRHSAEIQSERLQTFLGGFSALTRVAAPSNLQAEILLPNANSLPEPAADDEGAPGCSGGVGAF